MSQILNIVASDMVGAVGLSTPTSYVAIRYALDNFQETRFTNQGDGQLVGAPVMLPEPSSDYAQLVGMAVMVIAECMAGSPAKDIREMPLLFGVVEVDRPGRLAGLKQSLLQAIEEHLGHRFHERSCVIPRDRVSVVVAPLNARKLIEQGYLKVPIAGIDSYLTAATLAAYQERDQLLGSRYQDGFIPGEGTVAVLVTAACASEEPQLLCLGLGSGVEKATVESESLPLRAGDLTQAVKAAFTGRGFGYELVDYRLTGLPDEQYYFKEATLALSRALRMRKERIELWSPADCISECRAMASPTLLCITLAASRKGYAHGLQVLCYSGDDAGEQIAVALDYQRVRASQMANEVYTNGRELFYKSVSGKSIAPFPDVYFVPPQVPPTPLGVPAPYPNTGISKDTTRGNRIVRITRKEMILKNKSRFKKSYDDEAERTPKKGVITSINTSKVYLTSWSMDVKVEGLSVVRHLGLTTHNHDPSPGNTAT